jgi:hypothetical protein
VLSGQQLDPKWEDLLAKGCFEFLGRARRTRPQIVEHEPNSSFIQFFCETYPSKPLPTEFLWAKGDVAAEKRALTKYCKLQPIFEHEALCFAKHMLFREFYPVCAGVGIMSQDAAWLECDHSSSPGYPWSFLRTSKSDIWKVPKFQESMAAYFDELGTGEAWTPIWTSSIKTELRPTEKVLAERLRGFVASPIELTLAFIRLFGEFNSRLYAAAKNGRTWVKVGMSKYYRGWDELVKLVARKGPWKGQATDMSEMDSSLNNILSDILYDFRKECICRGDKEIAAKIDEVKFHVQHSVIITTDGHLLQKCTGNPSGSGNTSIDNSLALFLLLAYGFAVLLWPKYDLTHNAFGDLFMNSVVAFMYGDDDTAFFSPEISSLCNMQLLKPVFAKVFFFMTFENDDESLLPMQRLSFLSNGFWWCERYSVWVPRPGSAKLLASLLFGSKCTDVRWSILRAYAILIEGYWNDEVREVTSAYIDYLFRKYNEHFVDGEVYCGITWQSIKSVFRTHSQIETLYVGKLEGGVDTLNTVRHSTECLRRILEVVNDDSFSDGQISSSKSKTRIEAKGKSC